MREIYVEINGQFIEKSSKYGGVVGEGNVTKMRIVFDGSWEGYGKRIIWRNALGLDPVAVILGYDRMTGENTPLDYTVLIPPEPLKEAGWCSFTIEGYSEEDGIIAVAFTVSDRLEVKEGGFGTPAEPTPSQTLQLQYEIDGMIDEVAQEAVSARDSADRAEKAAEGLESAEKSAYESAQTAILMAAQAEYWAGQTQASVTGGVVTFNNRSGNVVPQSGDYTADMVGAEPKGAVSAHTSANNPHGITPGGIGAAAASHNHSAAEVAAGTLAGKTLANTAAQADLAVMQLRNISAGTAALTPGESSLAAGQIYLVYEE
ncbi:MAG: hypothetical protein IIW34_08760 [Clostridia bacterium]|nr:hypothetical protein [Clostridia bacterium]MBQ2326389.1 hypothetical protein [Clostridia bacterium]MBQ5814225.1 hypothetical protein [Clostridia bacterium]